MSAIIEALKGLPEPKIKKHFVKIDGNDIEVTLEQKLEVIKHGEERFMLDQGKLVFKPEPRIKSKWKKLVASEKGYHFLDDDIHWPEKVAEGGKTWQIEYE